MAITTVNDKTWCEMQFYTAPYSSVSLGSLLFLGHPVVNNAVIVMTGSIVSLNSGNNQNTTNYGNAKYLHCNYIM